jgi:putative ABC transport system ATP-binding protein
MKGPRLPSLVASGLHRGFGTGRARQDIIRGVSIEAYPGELTIIIGPSGSGKTTLLGLLSGLLSPDRGQIRCLGTSLEALSGPELEHYRLRHSGFVFQGFNLFSALTALEQVVLPLQYVPNFDQDCRVAARAALAEVGLAGKEQLRTSELSGGEKQRVAIARAIAKAPELLFADEPTSALDSENAERVVALFQELAHRRNSSIICVTHDERLLRYADRVLHLRDGVIWADPKESAP